MPPEGWGLHVHQPKSEERKDDIYIIQNHIALHAMLAHPHSGSMIETGIESKQSIRSKPCIVCHIITVVITDIPIHLIDRIRSICGVHSPEGL